MMRRADDTEPLIDRITLIIPLSLLVTLSFRELIHLNTQERNLQKIKAKNQNILLTLERKSYASMFFYVFFHATACQRELGFVNDY